MVAQPDAATGGLTVWTSTQLPHTIRTELAKALRLPQNAIRVIAPDVGGGFGVKGSFYPEKMKSADAKDNTDCVPLETVGLTPEFYKGDRAMRESGFDPSFRFGPYDADTQYYAPVCLNSLIYKWEKDLEQISALLGKEADSRQWHQRACQLANDSLNTM